MCVIIYMFFLFIFYAGKSFMNSATTFHHTFASKRKNQLKRLSLCEFFVCFSWCFISCFFFLPTTPTPTFPHSILVCILHVFLTVLWWWWWWWQLQRWCIMMLIKVASLHWNIGKVVHMYLTFCNCECDEFAVGCNWHICGICPKLDSIFSDTV